MQRQGEKFWMKGAVFAHDFQDKSCGDHLLAEDDLTQWPVHPTGRLTTTGQKRVMKCCQTVGLAGKLKGVLLPSPLVVMSGVPRLSYSQLFSFQVAHNLVEAQMAAQRYMIDVNTVTDLLKKGEWNRSIMEIDFTNGMVFLQDKDKIISAQPFTEFKKFVTSGEDFEDNLLSLRFNQQQWQVMVQNSAEKACLTHLLSAAARDCSAEEAIAAAPPNMLGLNKTVLRAGIMVRKAKTRYKKDERYLVLVPGKLFLFKSPELVGQHVRYVTSLMGASIKMLQGLEFEINVPGTKAIAFMPDNVEEMTGWMGALERSVEIAADLLEGNPFVAPIPPPEAMTAGPSSSPQTMNLASGQAIHFGTVNTAGGSKKGVISGLLRSVSPGVSPRFGGYTNAQDSRNILQRLAQGNLSQGQGMPGGLAFQSNSGPGGYTPYLAGGGNFQLPGGGGNMQPPFAGGNFPAYNMQPQGSYGNQHPGPSNYPPQQMNMQPGGGQMLGQRQMLGQGAYGPNQNMQMRGMNQPQANQMNPMQGAYNTPAGGSGQNMYQAGGQGAHPQAGLYGGQPSPQNRYAQQNVPGGVGMLRRATQTLREFNNNMDQYLSTPTQPSASRPMQQPQMRGPVPGMGMNPGPSQPASNDWQTYTSPDGRSYYHNARTNQTSWVKPF